MVHDGDHRAAFRTEDLVVLLGVEPFHEPGLPFHKNGGTVLASGVLVVRLHDVPEVNVFLGDSNPAGRGGASLLAGAGFV